MQALIDYIVIHSEQAYLFVFGAILLAGLNIPISLDIIMILSAFLAAQIIPEQMISLYLSLFLGCYFSAWIAYGMGRLLGKHLMRYRWFASLFPEKRMQNIKDFYEKHGFWTLALGRFIPFGVRNCIFMTTGMSKMSFTKFAIRDLFASFFWSSSTFFLFYSLGKNFDLLCSYAKTFNFLLFTAFGVTVIGLIWYKRKKRARKKVT
jgi:membrane protein DedA with SNARE-associated domain